MLVDNIERLLGIEVLLSTFCSHLSSAGRHDSEECARVCQITRLKLL